jgi:hypothetical protein
VKNNEGISEVKLIRDKLHLAIILHSIEPSNYG